MITILKTRSHLLLAIALLLFFALMLIDPQSVLESGRKAIELCLNIILPSLLPFFVISRIILNTGAIYTISRIFKPIMNPLFNLPGSAAFPLMAGWLSGYPAGAKYTMDLYKKGLLSRDEAQRILPFCNNSGPLFIVGAVGTGYFGSPEIGVIMLACHLLASITVGIGTALFSRKKDYHPYDRKIDNMQKQTEFTGRMLTDAIIDSTGVLMQISGTIIFFAVVVQTLETAGVFSFIEKILALITGAYDLYSEVVKVLLSGSTEITYGLYLLSQVSGIPMHYKVLLASFLCGFGGFSVHTQVTGLCPPEFKMKKYVFGKLVHGTIASIYTGVFMISRTIPVMSLATGTHYPPRFSVFLYLPYIILLISGIVCISRLRRRGKVL